MAGSGSNARADADLVEVLDRFVDAWKLRAALITVRPSRMHVRSPRKSSAARQNP